MKIRSWTGQPLGTDAVHNVVVKFESGRAETLSLRLDNFGDGSEFDGSNCHCWFRIEERATIRRRQNRCGKTNRFVWGLQLPNWLIRYTRSFVCV